MGRSRLAGTERHVLELARALPREKADVTVVVFSHGALVERLRQSGIDVRVFRRRSRFDLALLFRLALFFRTGGFDVVHGHPERIACLAAKLAGVHAVLMTYHLVGPQSAGLKKPRTLSVLAEKARATVVDATIAVSRSDAEFLVRSFGRNPEAVTFIANGMNVAQPAGGNRQSLLRDLRIDPSARLVVTAARLSRQKGVEYVVRAMKRVSEKAPGAVLVVAGEGELEAELRAAAARLGLAGSVVFAGYREDVLELVSVSDVFVLPSLWEGMPYALLEAMLLARPVVTTTVCSEVVEDGRTGLVVPPRDETALAGAILKLLARPDEASRIGLAGRERVLAAFSAGRMAGETLELYERVLSRRGGARTKGPE